MGCVLGKKTNGEDNDTQKGNKIEEVLPPPPPVVIPPEFILRRGVADGWPTWLQDVAGDAIKRWKPRRANTFEKLDKIGQGTYSNVYKARDLITGEVVALKKVRFDNMEAEMVKFMAREILVLAKLDHPNVIKLRGLVISRMSSSLYLVFDYMEHDLAGLAALHSIKFTEPQVKCYMRQLLLGLEHCHNNGVLHRDIKCSNLLISDDGILRIADFGLATFFDLQHKRPMTSRVVTLWYRPPELLLGGCYYDVGVDLWSAGCILAELLAGKPILGGKLRLSNYTGYLSSVVLHPKNSGANQDFQMQVYINRHIRINAGIFETFKDFPPSALSLITTLLSIDPNARGSATEALKSDFFTTEPYACEPWELPKFPPSKELDIKLREEEERKQRGLGPEPHVIERHRRPRAIDRVMSHGVPAPEANAEIQFNLHRVRSMSSARAKTTSMKFPPPHEDAAVGHHSQNGLPAFTTADSSFILERNSSLKLKRSSSKSEVLRRSRSRKAYRQRAPSHGTVSMPLYSSIGWDFWRMRRAAF